MIQDLASGGVDREARADICIVGAGPAGVTLALELAARGKDVILAEGGGVRPEPESQDLCVGESVGYPMSLERGRVRALGGATTLWTGRCTTLDDIDFERRDWVGHSGWPFGAQELRPYYGLAARYCGFERPWLDDQDSVSAQGVKSPAFDPERAVTHVWRFAPQHGGRRYRDWGRDFFESLRSASSIRLILHANAVGLEARSRDVSAMSFAALNGNRLRVAANSFVLCCGGAENTRLLLVFKEQAPELFSDGGEWVGRCFMQHPRGVIATVVATPKQSERLQDTFNVFARRGGAQVEIGFALPASVQRRERLLNASAILVYEADPSSSWERLKRAATGDLTHLSSAFEDPLSILRNVWRRGVLGRHPLLETRVIHVVVDLEQAPDPDSRLVLGSERDSLGLPRLRADWHVGRLEKATAARFATLLSEEFARLQLAEMRPAPTHDGLLEVALSPTFHHIGTTRMSDSPNAGVVDPSCRVHGCSNLFVQGCAVFPTGGHANPTFTIVALALRQADILTGEQ